MHQDEEQSRNDQKMQPLREPARQQAQAAFEALIAAIDKDGAGIAFLGRRDIGTGIFSYNEAVILDASNLSGKLRGPTVVRQFLGEVDESGKYLFHSSNGDTVAVSRDGELTINGVNPKLLESIGTGLNANQANQAKHDTEPTSPSVDGPPVSFFPGAREQLDRMGVKVDGYVMITKDALGQDEKWDLLGNGDNVSINFTVSPNGDVNIIFEEKTGSSVHRIRNGVVID